MQERSAKFHPVPENLDTAYFSLAALLRYLQQRDFNGWIHVELDDYEADIQLTMNERPRVRETDHASGRTAEGEAALLRLLVRASEPGGLVSVYESARGKMPAAQEWSTESPDPAQGETEDNNSSPEEMERRALVLLTGELIGTVERAALSTGADFAEILQAVCLSLADDYSFLDPSTGHFEYSNGLVQLRTVPRANAYISGVNEALRQVVNRISTGPRGQSVRERVALELAVLARRRKSQLTRFKFISQLDSIAGTRVL